MLKFDYKSKKIDANLDFFFYVGFDKDHCFRIWVQFLVFYNFVWRPNGEFFISVKCDIV